MLSWRRLFWATPVLAVACLMATALVFQQAADPETDINVAPHVAVVERDVPAVATPSASAPADGAVDPVEPSIVAELPSTVVKPFYLLGVTWASGLPNDAVVEAKWRSEGRWTSWQAIDLDLENTATEGGRPGTEPQWVGASDGVAVRVTSSTHQAPRDLQLVTIDPGHSHAITPVAFQTGSVAQPTVIPRSTWG